MNKTANRPTAADHHLAGVRTLEIEIAGLRQLKESLAGSSAFSEAVEKMHAAPGRIIVSGIGKSGHIGRKIAATLASTGTPAQFVHSAEASHGDLGMVTQDDVIVALSWSGESMELRNLLDYSRRFSIPLIAITARADSALGHAADIVLELPSAEEACPNGLAPTTSTTMQIALGDALAMALLEHNGFTAHDYRNFHPGGKLGAILRTAADLMHSGEAMPLAPADTPMAEALYIMTSKSFGCVGITDDSGRLIGLITDGDLRRHMGSTLLESKAVEIMTPHPKTIAPDTLASEALSLMAGAITSLFVVADDRPVGLLHIHDVLRAGVA